MDRMVWQDERPEPKRCSLRKLRCDAYWCQMEGEGGKTGWMWVCPDSECEHAIIAASGR